MEDRLKITPNPVLENQMVISLNAEENSRVQMQIVGSTGNPVQTKTVFLVQGSNQFPVDVSLLKKGLYTLVMSYSTGKIITAKFLKL
jgi:hypothetical protein